jgi:hypothetical protein
LKELRNEIFTKLENLTKVEAKLDFMNHLWRREMLGSTKAMRDDFNEMKSELKRELQGEVNAAIIQELKAEKEW